MCDNLIFETPMISEGCAEKLLSWPHWLLKSLYTGVGIMFGKFWKGEHELNRDGIAIPRPPVTFMSFRSAVIRKDTRFFNKALELRPALEAADDDGRNVHELFAPAGCDISSIESMRIHNYYHHISHIFLDAGNQQNVNRAIN